jgi:hypothetical protein
MAETIKVLGQLSPAATTLTDLYTVPASTSVVVSSIVACNRDTSKGSFRVSVAVAGATDDPKQYLFYDVEVKAVDAIVATIGITLGAADVVRVYASSANFSFNLFGTEVTE